MIRFGNMAISDFERYCFSDMMGTKDGAGWEMGGSREEEAECTHLEVGASRNLFSAE